MTQKELSKAAGVSESSISFWESDATAPRGGNLHRLADVLQCSPTWLLFGDEDVKPGEPRSMASTASLTDEEKEILRLYKSLPRSEQEIFFSDLKNKADEFNKLFTELLEARQRLQKE